MGLFFARFVYAANEHDSMAAQNVINQIKGKFSRMVKIIVDGGYRGDLIKNTKKMFGWVLEIVLRSDSNKGFQALPIR
ncbi:MAG: hypothetical protein IPO21_01830 [Bacteroidales bacterium]|nr:hypothetical protein [Bacteroidales bacterium]